MHVQAVLASAASPRGRVLIAQRDVSRVHDLTLKLATWSAAAAAAAAATA
jgi:hypothetical protein